MGCGRVAPQPELLRFAWDEGAVVSDGARRRAGRGAYLCPRRACLERANARRAWARAFRRAVIAVPENVHLAG